ncbi:MAG: tetratricopeptide repeat protein [Elusimicrobiales bacterium]
MIAAALALSVAVAAAPAPGRLAACTSAGKELFAQRRLPEAEAKFRECVASWPEDAGAHVSLAGVLMTLKKFDQAAQEFTDALEKIDPNSPLAAYCHSRLGDIAVKKGKLDEAEDRYRRAAAIDPREVNSIIGLGRCSEIKKDWFPAAENYRRALALEPGNEMAKQGLRRVEPTVMSDAEILSELKFRRALVSDASELSPEAKLLFKDIRRAEEYGGVNYLAKRLRALPPDYTVEKDTGTPTYRLMFSYAGYLVYRNYISSDAVRFFEKKGIKLKDVVKLRAKNGALVFDPKEGGRLSSDGLEVYYYAMLGRKEYILPSEPLPPALWEKLSESDKLEVEMKRDKYMEISESEYLWLCRATNCAEETFTEKLDMRIREIMLGDGKKRKRYFIDTTGMRKDMGALASHIYRYRSGDTDTSGSGSTGFFGLGGSPKQKLCDKYGGISDAIEQ